jgi:hypothetical protein
MRDRVADGGCRRKGKVNNAEGYAQSARSLLCDKLPHARNFEGRLFYQIRNGGNVAVTGLLTGRLYDAGPETPTLLTQSGLARTVKRDARRGCPPARCRNNKLGRPMQSRSAVSLGAFL